MTPELLGGNVLVQLTIRRKIGWWKDEERTENVLGALTVGVEDLDSKERCLLGYTIGCSAHGTGDVSAVTVAVGVLTVTGKVLEELGTTAKVLRFISIWDLVGFGRREAYSVVGVDASVDDVCAGACTGRVIVGISGAAGFLAGDAGQTPWGVFLGGGDGNDGVLFDEFDLKALSAADLFGDEPKIKGELTLGSFLNFSTSSFVMLAAKPLKEEYVWSAPAAMDEMADVMAWAAMPSFILTMYLPSITFASRGTSRGAEPERVAGAAKVKGRRARRVEERILKMGLNVLYENKETLKSLGSFCGWYSRRKRVLRIGGRQVDLR